MVFEGRTLQSITLQDLQDLVGNAIREDQTIDFKRDVYNVSDTLTPVEKSQKTLKKRVDLCTDISAIANGLGGWIICGIEADKGIASAIKPLSINPDDEIARLEKIARAGIEPYPYGLQIRAVDDHNGNFLLIIRVPRSYNAPHRVKETGKFHIRRSNGNDEMTMDEIRGQFTFTATFLDKVRAFRKERINAIYKHDYEELPIILMPYSYVVLHIVPLDFQSKVVDLINFARENDIWSSKFNTFSFNLNGFVRYYSSNQRETGRYIQVYRNGILECVHNFTYSNDAVRIPLLHLDKIIKFLVEQIASLKNFYPMNETSLALSLTKTKDLVFHTSNNPLYNVESFHINQNCLLVPDIVVQSFSQDPKNIKPMLDMLWNAGGFAQSLSYDEDGNWLTEPL